MCKSTKIMRNDQICSLFIDDILKKISFQKLFYTFLFFATARQIFLNRAVICV